MKNILLILAFFNCFVACLPPEETAPIDCVDDCVDTEMLLLNLDFEEAILNQAGTKAYLDSYGENPFIQYEEGDSSQRIAQVVADPLNPDNQVLRFQINEPHISVNANDKKSRIQLNYDDQLSLKEYYQTCKVFFPAANMLHLQQYPDGIYWLSIFEFWNNADWTGEAHPFRVTVGLYKKPGAGEEIIFRAKADQKNLFGFDDLWDERATDWVIPFGEWIDIELYILDGDEATGQFYMAVTRENGEKEVLFDVTNYTQDPDMNCSDGYKNTQPLKWYTNDEIVEYMRAGGHSLDIYWDDLTIHKNRMY